MLFAEVPAGKISVPVPMQCRCVCVCVSEMRCVCRHNVWLCVTWSSPMCLGALVGTSLALRILSYPLLLANFEFNHCCSTVFQITLSSSTPSHYPGHNWILEKPRGQARAANLLLICLWLVWPENLPGMCSVVRRLSLTWEKGRT